MRPATPTKKPPQASNVRKEDPKTLAGPPGKPGAIIKEGVQDEEPEEGDDPDPQGEAIQGANTADIARGESKFVKEAMKQIRDEEEEEGGALRVAEQEPTGGGGIKMGKIGGRGKKKGKGTAAAEPHKKAIKTEAYD